MNMRLAHAYAFIPKVGPPSGVGRRVSPKRTNFAGGIEIATNDFFVALTFLKFP